MGVLPRLTDFALRHYGEAAVVSALERLSGGASQELWGLIVHAGGAEHKLVLRRNPDGVARSMSASMETEARLMRLAREAGAPVPRIVHVLVAQDELGTGFIMERVPGESLAPRILRDASYAAARAGLARQMGCAAAQIHGIAARDLPAIDAGESLAHAQALYRGQSVDRPVVEWALHWLAHALPARPAPLRVVHGDYRNGNIIVGPEGLRAVLDWEGVHLGDPMEDLGWLCVTSWRFGNIDLPVGGFGTREELFAGYEATGGQVDRERVRFWEVLGTLRWGLMCGIMADDFRRGERSVEKAAIGRRASETALDLLAILAPRKGYDHA